MALKTFNIDGKIYKEYSKFCKEQGISMSKQIERFIENEVGKVKNAGKIKVENIEVRKKGKEKEIVHSFQKYC